jgi:hypothetical protein
MLRASQAYVAPGVSVFLAPALIVVGLSASVVCAQTGGWRNLNSLKRFGCPTLSGLVYERVGSLLLSLF